MPTRKRALDLSQAAMERGEDAAARQVALAYNQARRELLADILDRWIGQPTLTPTEAQDLVRRLGILRQVDDRLAALEAELGGTLRDVVSATEERALQAVERELSVLPRDVVRQVGQFNRINFEMIERFVPIVTDQLDLATGALRAQLRRELQTGLVQGESFPRLARRLLAADDSVFSSGVTSAERAVRRIVITAENAAKESYFGQAVRAVPAMRKQAVAVVATNTTETCLNVHGQIQDVGEPFELKGQPRFADRMQHPSFHWGCRTGIALWHPQMEQGGLNTANMRSSAEAQLRKRRE